MAYNLKSTYIIIIIIILFGQRSFISPIVFFNYLRLMK